MIKRPIIVRAGMNQKGFTLIELAIVLVIIGVLIGSFIGTFAQRIENARIAETEDELEEIKTALIGYAYANRYLPCPDCFSAGTCAGGGTVGNGVEDRNGGVCRSGNNVGTLPWVTLGLASGDAWGTRYRYWVDSNYVDDTTGGGNFFTLTSGNVGGQIDERAPDDTIDDLADNIVAVVISNGKNAYGGISTSGVAKEAVPVANIDELDNLDNDANNDFISRPPSDVNAATVGGEFDDILIWIPVFELKAKMVEADRLP
jgi:prepilin-type N-terminal cleavage/methylation domain-containing protein